MAEERLCEHMTTEEREFLYALLHELRDQLNGGFASIIAFRLIESMRSGGGGKNRSRVPLDPVVHLHKLIESTLPKI